MSVAALDVGRTRIGMAISDAEGMVHPLLVIERRSFASDAARIAVELTSRAVTHLIVGLPLNMDGSEGPRARNMRAFAERLAGSLQIPVELHDERLTTFEARERLRGHPMRRAARRGALDALAAALILESWLHDRGRRPT